MVRDEIRHSYWLHSLLDFSSALHYFVDILHGTFYLINTVRCVHYLTQLI